MRLLLTLIGLEIFVMSTFCQIVVHDDLEGRVSKLEALLSDSVETLNSDISDTRNALDQNNHKMGFLTSKLDDYKGYVELNNKSLWEYVEHAVTTPVTFSVGFKDDDAAKGICPKSVYTFDNILTNYGDGYNQTTGKFTARHTGLYVFFLNTMGNDGGTTGRPAIQKNGETLAAIWLLGKADKHDKGSACVATFMAKGDEVWVQSLGGCVRGGMWTIFTGFQQNEF